MGLKQDVSKSATESESNERSTFAISCPPATVWGFCDAQGPELEKRDRLARLIDLAEFSSFAFGSLPSGIL
jgi:hypothetical protein